MVRSLPLAAPCAKRLPPRTGGIMNYQPFENYGIIGDLHTVALVGMDGSIDFMCFPHFDSPTIFAALLDHRRGGRFQIAPLLEGARQKQLYLPDSNILLSRFLCAEGVAEISDFMTLEAEGQPQFHDLVRRVKTVRGEVPFRMVCDPRFDYGRRSHKVERTRDGVLFIPDGERLPTLRLRAEVPLELRDGAAIAEFTLHAGRSAAFVLEEVVEREVSPAGASCYVPRSFKQTLNYWRHWIGRSTYRGRWREMVNRSALTLKLLTSKAHGSIAASATFGLPEEIGGERNWDYRYTWIRDASFTVYGLIRLGYTEEAGDFMRWIEARCAEPNRDGSLQIMYGLDGRHDLTEEVLPHLEGYRGSAPVRIGNHAYTQLQLDIYGELMDSVYLYNKYGDPISHDLWVNLVRLVDWVCDNWRRKDEGIWEVRGGRQEFLYSRLMCWVAIDRALRLADRQSFPAPLDRWHKVRDTIYREILDKFWDPGRRAFIQHKGATTLDASNLLMPLVRFVGPKDPRWLSTLRGIEDELVDDSLVYRYRMGDAAADGMEGREG
jgi:GH15 family glucan-1,4-alpha-glucosidase